VRVSLVQTRKYWVPPENVNQVKALIVRHLPVLVYGKSSKKAPELSILTKGEAVQTNDGQVREVHMCIASCALCVCTVCALCVHCVCTVCALCVHCVCTMCALCVSRHTLCVFVCVDSLCV
jgi:hypothetical protein